MRTFSRTAGDNKTSVIRSDGEHESTSILKDNICRLDKIMICCSARALSTNVELWLVCDLGLEARHGQCVDVWNVFKLLLSPTGQNLYYVVKKLF